MWNPITTPRALVIGMLAAAAITGAAGPALAQASTRPQMANCLSPQSASQRQECSMQRQPFYTSDKRKVPPSDTRLEMNMDNGGGGTQMPVVPNTTGAPAMTGGATGLGRWID